jgi:hypothetical protein
VALRSVKSMCTDDCTMRALSVVAAKLSEVLFVEAVRRYTQQLPAGETGWLAGLRDQPVARALALMHGNISRD